MDYSVDDLWNLWRSRILEACHCHCSAPTRRHDGRPFVSPKPWITSSILDHISLKHKLYRCYLRTQSANDWLAYTQQRNIVTCILRKAKSDFICAKVDTALDIPRLHSLVRALHTKGSSEIPNVRSSGVVYEESHAKATAFNQFFISQSRQSVGEPSEPLPQIGIPSARDSLDTISTTAEEVQKLLSGLDTTKSSGCDGLPTKILKHAAKELAPSLATLFNESFYRGEITTWTGGMQRFLLYTRRAAGMRLETIAQYHFLAWFPRYRSESCTQGSSSTSNPICP